MQLFRLPFKFDSELYYIIESLLNKSKSSKKIRKIYKRDVTYCSSSKEFMLPLRTIAVGRSCHSSYIMFNHFGIDYSDGEKSHSSLNIPFQKNSVKLPSGMDNDQELNLILFKEVKTVKHDFYKTKRTAAYKSMSRDLKMI